MECAGRSWRTTRVSFYMGLITSTMFTIWFSPISSHNILLAHCHPAGIHLTVKWADIDDVVSLSGQLTRSSDITHAKGTRSYFSPEMSAKERDNRVRVGRKTDIWSFGCVLHQMAYGCSSVGRAGLAQATSSSTNDPVTRALKTLLKLMPGKSFTSGPCRIAEQDIVAHSVICDELKEVFEMCFRQDPGKRATALQLLATNFIRTSRSLEEVVSTSDLPDFGYKKTDSSALNFDRSKALLYIKQGNEGKLEFLAFNKGTPGSEGELEIPAFNKGTPGSEGELEIPTFNKVTYDDSVRPHLEKDIPTTVKLLHERHPIHLIVHPSDWALPKLVRVSLVADSVAEISFHRIDGLPGLPELFLPNLTSLSLNGCSSITISRLENPRYPKLKLLSVMYCTVALLENNFLETMPSLQHFFFFPKWSSSQCERQWEEPYPDLNKYSWLKAYLVNNPRITEKKVLALVNGSMDFRETPLPSSIPWNARLAVPLLRDVNFV